MPRKKVIGQRLQRQLDDESTAGPRTRARGRELASAQAALAELGDRATWKPSAWVARCDALHGLLYLDRDRYARAVGRRARETGASLEDVEAAVAGALCERAMQLCKLVYSRGGTPVFVESASRLVAEGLAEHDPWLSRLMRRARPPAGDAYLAEAHERGLGRWEATAMLAYLCETATDDLAAMCETERAAVMLVLWDGWDEDAELADNPLPEEDAAALRARVSRART
jgi:hypothetical protein